ncbi:replication-associated recombination protein A [Candidatus Deferrimicrobium sp.]|uniref:replication-associated recombination protein A n=1 Tax=Candidatus Deferrimicrobium sp. TaxID=3060586 RepID=UPI0027234C45|nr:replication-associated recombination protein A [Candidatus Deferrimicrobium sp.]MDO8739232.1 replication-associated recombination protein A [Candidatus Deferrimicrobium sp.]
MIAPLADRMRPATLSDFVGQEELLGEGKFLSSVLSARPLPSLIFWGPPGSGKTTLARILAVETNAVFLPYSAVLSGIKEIREALAELKRTRAGGGPAASCPAILFIDEIHRWNKAQQDALLPFVEEGTVTLFGTTTENPSFEIRNALLSRSRVLVLSPLLSSDLETILRRALTDADRGLGKPETFLAPEALRHIVAVADGDARVALNALESAVAIAEHKRLAEVDMETAEEALRKKALLYDKDGEEHYNLISALHKSLRGSDPDAALYWLARMLSAGEDPLYVARRMIRFASEDIGNAAPGALQITLAAAEAYRTLGSPEGELALAQAAVYLATAPKSNRIYTAWQKATRDAETEGTAPVPLHLRNAPTRMMKELGYGKEYKYPHDFADAFVPENYFPETLGRRKYYEPSGAGHEKVIADRLKSWWGGRK